MDALELSSGSKRSTAEPLLAPASLAQRRLWLIDKLVPGSPVFNNAHGIRLRGVLDQTRLHRAIIAVAARHQTLRMQMVDPGAGVFAEPSVRVLAEITPELALVDLSDFPLEQRQQEANRIAAEFARQAFDLSTGPLFRTRLLRLTPEEHLLVFIIHHIISDRWSSGILLRELGMFYGEGGAPLPAIEFAYTDFARWQIAEQAEPEGVALLQYWRELLDKAPPFLDLPADHARPASFKFDGAIHAAFITPELHAGVKRLGLENNATPFMTYMTAFLVLLHRLTGQADLVIGTPVAGRSRLETEELIGCFINILPLRAGLQSGQSFIAALETVQSTVLELLEHQEISFDRIVEAVAHPRDPGRHPLFDIIFNFHNVPAGEPWTGGLKAELEEIRVGISRFDLALTMRATVDGGMVCEFEYSSELFESATIERWAQQFVTLIEGIVADPDCAIGTLPLLDASARRTILEEWSGGPGSGVPATANEPCVHLLFEQQAARTPERDALVCGHDWLTYAELNRRANQLAWRLRDAGVGPEKLVAICLQRTIELPIAILAVLKAGGAYVPLDPAYPPLRLTQMLEVARPIVLLTQTDLADRFAPEAGRTVLCVDRLPAAKSPRDDNPPTVLTPSTLAYVIFTSGSTGQPKGVAIEHRGPAALVAWANRTFTDEELRGMLFSTSVCFDLSVFELFVPLAHGAKIILVATVLDLPQAPAAEEVTFIDTVPSAMTELIRMGGVPLSTRAIGLGGEALPAALACRCYELPQVLAVYNLYGPTEDSVYSTSYQVPKNLATSPAIGWPIAGTRTYILDLEMQPVPVGATSELYLGGKKLARGYLHRPELTAERFVPNPFSAGEKLYRTGDLCKWNSDGSIQYLGRIDHQVKLRGFRIELGEIETILGTHPAVIQRQVIARGEASDQRLIAYLVVNADPPPPAESFREYLGRHLPSHMIPAAFVFLKSMPLTPNGKLDRKALPAPEVERPANRQNFERPRSGQEVLVAEFFEELLKIKGPGIHDNFFDLGGHSLLAVQLVARIERTFGRMLPLATFFRAPTIAGVTAQLAGEGKPEVSVIALQPRGHLPPLFCLPGFGGHVIGLRQLAALMGDDRPFYGIQPRGLDGRTKPDRTIERIAAFAIEQMRSVQPQGPYHLVGFSAGGIIAFEMAQQLQSQGQTVAGVLLIDTSAPGYPAMAPLPKRILLHCLEVLRRSPREKLRYMRERLHRLRLRLKRKTNRWRNFAHLPNAGDSISRIIAEHEEATIEALDHYVPRPYTGNVILMCAENKPTYTGTSYDDPHMGWDRFVPRGLDLRKIPGTHGLVIHEPYVGGLAAAMLRCLEELRASGSVPQSARGSVPVLR